MNINSAPVVEAVDLKKYFKVKSGTLHAVDGVSFQIEKGTTLGIVGESGCGKSTLGRITTNILKPTAGKLYFKGEDVGEMSKRQARQLYRQISMIFQDPYSSLNPRMSVEELIADPLIVNHVFKSRQEMNFRVRELMDTVGLAQRVAASYPHELDGGRRQRIGIAKALALDPEFIVCDEPVSALDVSIQAQILNLLMDLQEERGIAYMFITHDLSVVRHISQTICVMYMGQCVERASADELFENPVHPYTRALLDALPIPNIISAHRKRSLLKGEVTNPINPQPGCRFAARCPHCNVNCTEREIEEKAVGPNHTVCCAKI